MKAEPIGNGYSVLVDSVHTFGTDAILLADFAAPKKTDTAVDLCTGCGIIPMLWAKNQSVNKAYGVEIQPAAVELFSKTITDNKVEDSIFATHADLKELKGKLPFGEFDLVTCNPPYKAPGAGIKNTDPAVIIARHEVACTLEDVIASASKLLRFSGRLCLCHRPERIADIICLMRQYKIEPKRLRLVAKQAGKEAWLVLVEGRLGGKSGMRTEPTLYVEDGDDFSKEMKKIYGTYKYSDEVQV